MVGDWIWEQHSEARKCCHADPPKLTLFKTLQNIQKMRIRYSAWCHMTLKTVTSESGWSWIWAIDNYISDHFLHIREKSRQRAEGQGTRGGRLVSTPDLEPGCRLVSTPDLETGCGFRANHAFLGSPALAGTWSQSWGAPRPGLTGVLSTQFLLKCPTAPPSAPPG